MSNWSRNLRSDTSDPTTRGQFTFGELDNTQTGYSLSAQARPKKPLSLRKTLWATIAPRRMRLIESQFLSKKGGRGTTKPSPDGSTQLALGQTESVGVVPPQYLMPAIDSRPVAISRPSASKCGTKIGTLPGKPNSSCS
jgi:hypothetical protein